MQAPNFGDVGSHAQLVTVEKEVAPDDIGHHVGIWYFLQNRQR